ncbi:hypothetical protein H5P28_11790 [Ruficoccus amylovorans]|uniref:Uncharacterized protein n=1 Tax=Ruficoccus amylovorans TaxID=1804625 RepID=A0A842HF96_9BACT|nr:hypothetical protein [Ruficoccus amylovorans]MBC2594939.1 hypothetical protein [Ruficoccus amylovorans]
MSIEINPFYHWSPRSRLGGIKRKGLVPGKRGINGPLLNDDGTEWLAGYVCLGTTAATAWNYSHGIFKVPGVYDLWEVYLLDSDEVHYLPTRGTRMCEVRVSNRIPKGRLIWVGEREIPPGTPKMRGRK